MAQRGAFPGGAAVVPVHQEEEGGGAVAEEEGGEDRWAQMPPDLLSDILGRVELSEDRWPVRKNVVACACVCKRWREITMGIVSSPPEPGKITFPSSLKQVPPMNPPPAVSFLPISADLTGGCGDLLQPGPKDLPLQCFIKRNKKTSTFYLYLSLSPSKPLFLLPPPLKSGRIPFPCVCSSGTISID